MGIIRTVCGDIDSLSVSRLLMHEHVLFDIVPPQATGDRHATIDISNRWQIDYRSNDNPANAHQQDVDIASAELSTLAADGGGLIVDQSVGGLARDALGLLQASRASGVAVVACAGLYTESYLDDATLALDVDALTERFILEVTVGLDGTNVRAGLIGEIGCSWPLAAVEGRSLVAAARASVATGAAISVHPGRHPQAAHDIVDILLAEGAQPARIIISHMDRTYPDGKGIQALLERGVNVEWDFFGIEQSHYWMAENVEIPTDGMRLRLIRKMVDAGFAERILLSQDICTKTRLTHWGGHGYGHLFRNVLPLMRQTGFEDSLTDILINGNPRRLLTIEENLHDN